jgi:ABC-type transport system involved in multi-copper enzyme maturation permease subunit
MSSRAIKPKRDTGGQGPTWQAIEERAPSVMYEEGPSTPRYVAVFSLMLITLGGAAMLFWAWNRPYLIPVGWGFFLLACGVTGLLYHAFYEKEFQFRRLYGALGFLLFAAAVFLRVAPIGAVAGNHFLPYGALSLLLSLGFLLCFIRNETETKLRTYALNLVGLSAAANALAGFIGGMISETFLLQTGILHLIFGLLFAAGYVGMEGLSTPRGFWAGRGIGIVGLALFLVALGRSLLPWLFFQLNWAGRPPRSFFLPSGIILIYLAVEYLVLYLGICSDNKLIVLTRRELGSFFFSPIAYIVLIGMALVGWLNYVWLVNQILEQSERAGLGGGGVPEPIVQPFLVSFLALIPLIFLVPIITMRMLSDEKRTGTLEVLLTAPVNEWHVVLAKFLAGLRVFLLCWYVWGLFLLALRVEGGKPFDYHAIITFLIALLCMGSGFVAMGLFFSSVTRHQILAAVFTFVVMMVSTLLFLLGRFVSESSWINTVINYLSYVELWIVSARGTIVPRLLVLHASLAIFWLYLSTKVLEARKWS